MNRNRNPSAAANDDEQLLHAGFRYALSLRSSRADAEDLVHDAWLRLYGNGEPARNRGAFFVTIRNLFIDRYRREQLVAFESIDDDTLALELPPMDESVLLPQMERCLTQLRSLEREVLFLHAVEGYSMAAIAKLTGNPRGTVLSLVHRAKLKIRRALELPQEKAPLAAGDKR